MDGGDDTVLAPDGSTRVLRACDACRSRKIRCDRQTPCSNCRASKLNCQTTTPTQKVQKQRVHISDEYEKKVDRIEDRLTGIERILERLEAKLNSQNIRSDHKDPNSPPKSSRTGKSPISSPDIHSNSPAPFEGETAFNAQSEFARDLLERAVGSTPSIGQNTDIQTALASLQNMVSKKSQFVATRNEPHPLFTMTSVSADTDATKLERPPWEAVSYVIDQATVRPTLCFVVVFPYLQMHNIKDIFREVFDAPEESSPGRRLLIYGVLYNLFTEFSSFPLSGPRIRKFEEYAQQSRKQMEVAISQLDLFLPASYENIIALLLGAGYAVELSKPSLCWIMTSTAGALCQDLGYHRIATMKDDTIEERTAKIHIFWFIYIFDKGLSLRLGRASAIQDWDISLPYPIPGEVPSPVGIPKGTQMQLYWIKVARIQGQVYEQLFSAAAFLKSSETRAQIARGLANEMNQAWLERGEISVRDFGGSSSTEMPSNTQATPSETEPSSSGPFVQPKATHTGLEDCIKDARDLIFEADAVVHYSTVCLIQSAVKSNQGTFSHDCLESARAALMAHQRCSRQFNTKGNENLWLTYVHWTILQAPFTPFIVLFCNAISTCFPSDLSALSDFVLSLEPCRSVSEGAERLYKMCHLFLSVAKIYVEAKAKESTVHKSSNVGNEGFYGPPRTANGVQLDYNGVNEIDPYLSALGLVPNAAWPMQEYPMQLGLDTVPQGMPGLGGNQDSVQHWFSASRYIMGLMEDDTNMPDMPDGNL